MRSIPLFVIASLLILAACREPPPPSPAPEAPPTTETPPPVALTPTDAPPTASPTTAAAPLQIQAIIGDGAKFQFAFKESADVLNFQTARCAAEAKGDAAKQAACLDAVARESAGEGIRFEKKGDAWTWTSYGVGKDGKEELYLAGPVTMLPAPADELHFQPAGAFVGIQAAAMGADKAPAAPLPPEKFTVVKARDAQTIEMVTAGPKGTLVYRKAK